MPESPFERNSMIYSQGLIFIVVLVWGFMGFEIAQYRLLNLYDNPLDWISWATLLFISLLPVLVAITWRMKTKISYTEPAWDFRESEITVTEYQGMMKQYRGAYQHVLSITDYPMIIIAAVMYGGAVLFPFVTMRTTIYLVATTPIIFGLLVLPFGIVFSNVVFKFIPNEATPFFPTLDLKQHARLVSLMGRAPGVSWAGVRVKIGESGGYYTVRDAIPVARIEDIESVARIECQLDESRDLLHVTSLLQLEGDEPTLIADESPDNLTLHIVAQLVQKTLLAYVEARGERELLEDVIEEVENYLKRFNPTT